MTYPDGQPHSSIPGSPSGWPATNAGPMTYPPPHPYAAPGYPPGDPQVAGPPDVPGRPARNPRVAAVLALATVVLLVASGGATLWLVDRLSLPEGDPRKPVERILYSIKNKTRAPVAENTCAERRETVLEFVDGVAEDGSGPLLEWDITKVRPGRERTQREVLVDLYPTGRAAEVLAGDSLVKWRVTVIAEDDRWRLCAVANA